MSPAMEGGSKVASFLADPKEFPIDEKSGDCMNDYNGLTFDEQQREATVNETKLFHISVTLLSHAYHCRQRVDF